MSKVGSLALVPKNLSSKLSKIVCASLNELAAELAEVAALVSEVAALVSDVAAALAEAAAAVAEVVAAAASTIKFHLALSAFEVIGKEPEDVCSVLAI